MSREDMDAYLMAWLLVPNVERGVDVWMPEDGTPNDEPGGEA